MGIEYDKSADNAVMQYVRAFLAPGIAHPSAVVQVGDKVMTYGVDLAKQKYGMGSLDIKWRSVEQLPAVAQTIVRKMAENAIARAQGLEKSLDGEHPLAGKMRRAIRGVYRTVCAHAEAHGIEGMEGPIGERARKNLHDMHAYHAKGDWPSFLNSARSYHLNTRPLGNPNGGLSPEPVAEPVEKSLTKAFGPALDLLKGPKPGRQTEGADFEGLTSQHNMAHHVIRQREVEDAYRARHSTLSGQSQRDYEKAARPDRIHGMVKQAHSRWDTADASVRGTPEGLAAHGHLTQARAHLAAGQIDHAHQQLTRYHWKMDQVQEKYGHSVKGGLAVNPREDYMLKSLAAGQIEQVHDHEQISEHDDPDGYLYHVTTAPAAQRILREGFKPTAQRLAGNGQHAQHSRGRTFFTERGGVGMWSHVVENHLVDQHDDPPAVAVLRVPREHLEGQLMPDERAKDVTRHAGYYVPHGPTLHKSFQRAIDLLKSE
jgi:hypothetical protein